ncbi:hypothetical protein E2C01_069206 [Portunus trituberculatus]|uniref:Uncharacterized protein n=1 Tax=Portunus trituberculatus TaxID=210409 RepID=A0A5B7HQU6_PORTR|nr:hypothetical protein [Portunus trituberculatus]
MCVKTPPPASTSSLSHPPLTCPSLAYLTSPGADLLSPGSPASARSPSKQLRPARSSRCQPFQVI